MNSEQLKGRAKKFSVQVIRFTETWPTKRSADVIARQLIRAATAVGANYRAACRARSKADFISKLRVVEEEADECMYWIEVAQDSLGDLDHQKVSGLHEEARQLTAIFAASGKTARSHKP